jgi:hypothetical protein
MNGINLCTVCGRDMGDNNPRQLCRKTYCELELQMVDEPVVELIPQNPELYDIHNIDDLVDSSVFIHMRESKSFQKPCLCSMIDFIRKYQHLLTVYTGVNFSDSEGHLYCIELNRETIITYNYKQRLWRFFRYQTVNVHSPIYEWNTIVYDVLSPEVNSHWVQDCRFMYVDTP